MRLLGSTTKDVDKNENGENVQKLESVEVVLFTVISSKMIINYFKSFIYFCSKQAIWSVNRYCTSFFKDIKYNTNRIFIC